VTESPKRKSAQARRREILDAVIDIATTEGFAAISARDVAVHVGVAPGLIHHYFESMDELLAESFGMWADDSLAQLKEISASESPRVALALTVVNLTPEQRIWNDALSAAARYRHLRDRAKRLSEEYLAHVASLIQAGVDEGQFHCTDPRTSAWRIILILDGTVAMMHILDLIRPEDLPTIIAPVIERELDLPPDSFSELTRAVLSASGLGSH
jgi:AcrR family transcriptional regulator